MRDTEKMQRPSGFNDILLSDVSRQRPENINITTLYRCTGRRFTAITYLSYLLVVEIAVRHLPLRSVLVFFVVCTLAGVAK